VNVNPIFGKPKRSYIITDEQRQAESQPKELPAYAQKIMTDGPYAGQRVADVNNTELHRLLNECEDTWDELCSCYKLVLRDRAVGGVQ
jgi:hypothetical protein